MYRKNKMRVVAATAVTAVVIAAAGTAQAADATGRVDTHTGTIAPAAHTRAAGGVARDYSWDGVPDLLVRDAGTGLLFVRPHSGVFQGTETYGSPDLVGNDWSDMRWIGAGRFSRLSWQSGLNDLVAVTTAGDLVLATHTRGYPGLDTFSEPRVVGTGWNDYDLLFTHDYNGDAYEDILARRAGTGDLYLFPHQYLTNTFGQPVLVLQGTQNDDWLAMADKTGDGVADLLFRQDGALGVYSFADNLTTVISTGWNTADALVVADVDRERGPDLITRDTNGDLRVHRDSGIWNPRPDGTAPDAYLPPVDLGYGWGQYDWLS
jgi:hypothetical protein